jgi:hypothetical protein
MLRLNFASPATTLDEAELEIDIDRRRAQRFGDGDRLREIVLRRSGITCSPIRSLLVVTLASALNCEHFSLGASVFDLSQDTTRLRG